MAHFAICGLLYESPLADQGSIPSSRPKIISENPTRYRKFAPFAGPSSLLFHEVLWGGSIAD
jgi:hypothetical protein